MFWLMLEFVVILSLLVDVIIDERGGKLGARSLNAELQKLLNEKSEPKVIGFGTTFSTGDKVLQTVNNYEKEVYNGDIGVIASIDMEEGLLQVDYDGRLVEVVGELDEVLTGVCDEYSQERRI